ncbi:MAG: hypothetical protein ACK4SX_14425 [Alcanivoracaceae bacterium]
MLITLSGCMGSSQESGIDPRLGEAPIAYVIRPTPIDGDDGLMLSRNEREPVAFYPGGELLIRDAASPRAVSRAISLRVFTDPHDVRDLSPAFNGRRLLFSLRAPDIPGADDDDQPRWNVWEYNADTDSLRRIISSNLIAEEGHDLMPRYLPDGRILFVSDRQRQSRARLLDEGKPQFAPQEESRQVNALALHVMNSDGSDIRQISFNPSHDLSPLVLNDGRLLLVRWDNSGNTNEFNLYSMNPDGSAVSIVYGADSHDPADPAPFYTQPALLEDGRVLVMKRPLQSRNWSALPLVIDIRDFINRDQPLIVGAGEAETLLLPLPVLTGDEVSSAGRFTSLAPLNDGSGRLLAAWAPCRLRLQESGELLACTDDNRALDDVREAEPAYGLWIFDPANNRQLPVLPPADGIMIGEVAVMSSRPPPAVIADGVPGAGRDLALAERDAGLLNIRSVYDVAGEFVPRSVLPVGVTTLEQFADPALVTADQRAVRFLRIAKTVLIPDRDTVMLNGADFGRLPAFGMREIVGYVPVAPDGSVRVEVPANVALDIQLVDASGRRVGPQHGAWLSVRPGEEFHCSGCHEPGSSLPHGRADAERSNINQGAPVTGLPFPNTRPELFADAGETMAEVLTRVEPARRRPALDLLFEDIWTDPLVRTPDDDLLLVYSDLDTPSPESDPNCLSQWAPLCRSIIHYHAHIQPLWDLPREVEIDTVLTDVTCSACHSRRDGMGALQVPPAQLELTADTAPEAASQLVSYRELLFPDNALIEQDGALVDQLVPLLDGDGNPVFVRDEEGNLVLDENDDPIPVQQTVTLTPAMVAGTARNSRFFAVFAGGGEHTGWLSRAELRLLAEWLDIGAQNYNDPFVVPQ